MAYTTTEILDIASICQFLSKDDEARSNLFRGKYERIGLSRLIYLVRDAVQWLFDYNPSSDNLLGQSNYLFSLCQPYVGQALQILGSGGSGTIVNPATGVQSTIEVVYLEFIVGTTSSPQLVNGVNVTLPVDGESQIILPIPDIMNKSISVTKDNVPLPIGFNDRESFTPTYTTPSVTISVNVPFQNGDLFVIQGLQFVSA